KLLFSLGIFAAACGSFMVNAMIGGTVFSDGLGLGASMDGLAPKMFAGLALAISMNIGLYVIATGQKPVQLTIAAQTLTVLAGPILAGAMVYLAFRPMSVPGLVAWWMKLLAICALVLQMVLATERGVSFYNDWNGKSSAAQTMPAEE